MGVERLLGMLRSIRLRLGGAGVGVVVGGW